MFTAKLGALFLAPLMAATSFFGGGHANTNAQSMVHANNAPTTQASSAWNNWENQWNNDWNNWFHKPGNGDHGSGGTGTTTGTTTPPVTATTTVSLATTSPDQGPVGTTVTLTGTGFTSDSQVHFGSGVIKDPTVTSSTTITFTVPKEIAPYCAPGVACPLYIQEVTPGDYNVYVTNANGTSNTQTFTVTKASKPSPTPSPLSITGLNAPVALTAGTSGTWQVHVAVPDSFTGNLHYSVKWGDEGSIQPLFAAAMIHTEGTFTHTYESAGTYKPVFTVTDDSGHSATTSAKVIVKAAS